MTIDLMQSTVTIVFFAVWAIVGQIIYREARDRRRLQKRTAENLPLA